MQRLSVLDQSPVPEGATGADALANTLDLVEVNGFQSGLCGQGFDVVHHSPTPSMVNTTASS